MQPRLAYWYAVIDTNNCCVGVQTTTYEVPWNTYIPIPVLTSEYMGKYYKRETDEWFYDQECTQLFTPEA